MTDQETKKLDPTTIAMAASVPVIAIILMVSATLAIQSEPSRFLASAQSCYDGWLAKYLEDIRQQQTKAAEVITTSTVAKSALSDLQNAADAIPDGSDFWDYKREHGNMLTYDKNYFYRAWSRARKYQNHFYNFSGLSGDYPAGDVEIIVAADRVKMSGDAIERDKQGLRKEVEVNGKLLDALSETEKVMLSKQQKLKDPSVSDADKWYIINEPGAKDCMPGSIVTSIAEWRMK